MKTKIFLLAVAIMTSSFAFAINPVKHEASTDCEKKVLKQIKKQMYFLNVKDYLEEGERQAVVITARINDQNTVEIVKVSGTDEELKEAIVETLEDYPVKRVSDPSGDNFTFKMVFEHRPA
jgi:hypothetical protein